MDGEFKNNLNLFLKNYAPYIALGVVVLILISLLVLLLINRKKVNKKEEIKISTSSNDWIISLGGEDNIIETSSKGSRLTLNLKDITKIDETKLKELGVSSILKMSNKLILVLEDNASKIEQIIKK